MTTEQIFVRLSQLPPIIYITRKRYLVKVKIDVDREDLAYCLRVAFSNKELPQVNYYTTLEGKFIAGSKRKYKYDIFTLTFVKFWS